MHWGSSPSHFPVTWHTLVLNPFSTKPVLQVYWAVNPKVVPATLTSPFAGAFREPQSITENKSVRIRINKTPHKIGGGSLQPGHLHMELTFALCRLPCPLSVSTALPDPLSVEHVAIVTGVCGSVPEAGPTECHSSIDGRWEGTTVDS